MLNYFVLYNSIMPLLLKDMDTILQHSKWVYCNNGCAACHVSSSYSWNVIVALKGLT
jgi:hypothetical protein